MSNMLKEAAMQQALEALEEVDGAITALLGNLLGSPDEDAPGAKVRASITALRGALSQEPEPVQEPLVWEPVVLDLPALTQREYDALHADLRWNYKKITPPKVEPKFFDTVLYTESIERATPIKPAPPGLVGITTVSSVSVATQHRVLTDADLDAIRKIVREGGKE